jgi:amino acid adenylation domain-containing protein
MEQPLTLRQQGMLARWLVDAASGDDVVQLCLRYDAGCDVDRLVTSWRECVGRHALARVSVDWRGRVEPAMVVGADAGLPVAWREAGTGTGLDQFLAADRTTGFALDRAPLIRLTVLAGAGTRSAGHVVCSAHAIVLDAPSMELLLDDVGCTMRGGMASDRPPFGDYSTWLAGRDLRAAGAYWRSELEGAVAPTRLLADRPGGAVTTRSLTRTLPAEVLQGLRRLGRERALAAGTVVEGAVALVLTRNAGASDVVFGVATEGGPAELPGAGRMLGCLVNTVPVRHRVPVEGSVAKWLAAVGHRRAARRPFEHVPLPMIHRWSGAPGGRPLFETLLAFSDDRSRGPASPAGWPGLEHLGVRCQSHYPLTWEVSARGEVLTIRASYHAPHFGPAMVERWTDQVAHALAELTHHPDQRVGAVPLWDTSQQAAQRTRLTATTPYASDATIPGLFAAQAAAFPRAPAVRCRDRTLSYGQLDQLSDRLARRLRCQGVGPGMLVATCMERSTGMIVGLLGIARAGGAYVPIDPGHPVERQRYMLDDCEAAVVVTEPTESARFESWGMTVICVDEEGELVAGEEAPTPPRAARDAGPDDPAYVIYTSGSTGVPKGVVVEHRNVVRLFAAAQDAVGFGPGDVWSVVHSTAFDFSVWEIWGGLLHGGCVVVVPLDVARSPWELAATLVRHDVTHLSVTPSAFAGLVAEALPKLDGSSLRSVVFGGEALHVASVRNWIERFGDERPALVNMYGITETTVHVTAHRLTWGDVAVPAAGTPIGRPLPDMRVYVVDGSGTPLPDGIPGEMWVAGAGVARGYLRRPELTGARFVADPLVAGERAYRSGDLARYRLDGTLQYLGRIDDQVKIRGYRIELDEIDMVLMRHPAVRACATLAADRAGARRLITYVVPELPDDPPPVDDLRSHCGAQLPLYMVPARFMVLDHFPVTTNGKLDRRALLEAHHSRPGAGERDGSAIADPRPPADLVPVLGDALPPTTLAELASAAEIAGPRHRIRLPGA